MEADLKKIELAKAAQLWAERQVLEGQGQAEGASPSAAKRSSRNIPTRDYARMAREELARIKPEDKVDRPHPKYEEKSASLARHRGEPNAFEDRRTAAQACARR